MERSKISNGMASSLGKEQGWENVGGDCMRGFAVAEMKAFVPKYYEIKTCEV